MATSIRNPRIQFTSSMASMKGMLWSLFGANQAEVPVVKQLEAAMCPSQKTDASDCYLQAEQMPQVNLPSIALRTNSVTMGCPMPRPSGVGAAAAGAHHAGASQAPGHAGLKGLHPPAPSNKQGHGLESAVPSKGSEARLDNQCSKVPLRSSRQGSGGMAAGGAAAAAGSAVPHQARRAVRLGVHFPQQDGELPAASEAGVGRQLPGSCSDTRGRETSGQGSVLGLGSILLIAQPGEAAGGGGGKREGEGKGSCSSQLSGPPATQISPGPPKITGMGVRRASTGKDSREGDAQGSDVRGIRLCSTGSSKDLRGSGQGSRGSPLVPRRSGSPSAVDLGNLGARAGRSGKYGPDPGSNLRVNDGWRSRQPPA